MGFSDHAGDELDKLFVICVRKFQSIDIFPSRDRWDDRDIELLLKQDQIMVIPSSKTIFVSDSVKALPSKALLEKVSPIL